MSLVLHPRCCLNKILCSKYSHGMMQRLMKANFCLTSNRYTDEPNSKGNIRAHKAKDSFEDVSRRGPMTWFNTAVGITMCGCVLGYMYYLNVQRDKQRESDRKRQLGKTLIGGPWELVNHDGKLMSNRDYLGKWTLIYFGFTHCPDVCPDEIEKMVKVLNELEKNKKQPIDIAGLFFTVDPGRDTPEKIKTYITEFSPKLMGFTGTKEQVEKVCKTFRVYFSQGPKDQFADYIVDHTIIIYLVDPEGNFVDYYGQRTDVDEIVSNIQLLDMKEKYRKREENGELSIIERLKTGLVAST